MCSNADMFSFEKCRVCFLVQHFYYNNLEASRPFLPAHGGGKEGLLRETGGGGGQGAQRWRDGGLVIRKLECGSRCVM